MVRRFTRPATAVFSDAWRAAQECKVDEIGTECLLLALLQSGDDWTRRVLKDAALARDEVVAALVTPGRGPAGVHAFTTAAKQVTNGAFEEAQRPGHDSVGPEHLLLALAGLGDATSAYLATHGLEYDTLRERLAAEGSRSPTRPESRARCWCWRAKSYSSRRSRRSASAS